MGPFLNPLEQALPDAARLVALVESSTYEQLFLQVWGQDAFDNVDLAYDYIGYSIAAYEGSPESNAFSSKFDAWKAGKTSLTKEEVKGFALFVGKGKCAKCHTASGKGGTPALFTDFTYENLGLPINPRTLPTWPTRVYRDLG